MDTLASAESEHAQANVASPVSNLTKVLVVMAHLAAASVCMFLAWWILARFNENALQRIEAAWTCPPGVMILDGGARFVYDDHAGKIRYQGLLDLKEELRIRGLFDLEHDSTGARSLSGSALNEARKSYDHAIDELSMLSDGNQVTQTSLLLILGILGGIVGAVLRSSGDFVGHACYTGRLDLQRWWPLYAMRPIIGGILGFVIVILLRARIIGGIAGSEGVESFWWIGVAVLGGFSTVDVTQRLRLAAKALFGAHGEKDK